MPNQLRVDCIGIAEYSRMNHKKPQSEALTYNKMRPVNAKALPIIAFALTGRIVLLGFILCVGRESDVPLLP